MMKNISHITLYKLTYELVKVKKFRRRGIAIILIWFAVVFELLKQMEEYKMNEIIYNDGTFLANANVNNI